MMLYPANYPNLEYMLAHRTIFGVELLPEDVLTRFYETLILHIGCVQEAGVKLGVFREQLEEHDRSKFTLTEFNAYARHFQGGGAPDEFALAWLNHLHSNKHHWQYWMFPDGYTPKGSNIQGGIIEMPERYALEMVADWMGASKAYTGTEDMTDWLWKNIPRISLHSETAKFVRGVLRDLGYNDVLSLNFRSEVLLASHNV